MAATTPGAMARRSKMSISFIAPEMAETPSPPPLRTPPVLKPSPNLSRHLPPVVVDGRRRSDSKPMVFHASSELTPDRDLSGLHSPTSTTNRSSPSAEPRARHRHPRPCYTEEQKFFIMYMRILCAQPWPIIEARFVSMFGETAPRSKGGLTSVYYRIRKEWGLEEVLRSTGTHALREDQNAVARKAACFSSELLREIGYLK